MEAWRAGGRWRWGGVIRPFSAIFLGKKRERRDLQSIPDQMSNVEANLLRFQKWVLRPQNRKKTDSMIHKRIRERIKNTFRITRHCPLPPLASRKPGDGLNFEWVLRPQNRKKTDSMIHKRNRERIINTFRITRHCPLPPLASRKPGDGLRCFWSLLVCSMGMALVSDWSGCEKDSMKKKWKC